MKLQTKLLLYFITVGLLSVFLTASLTILITPFVVTFEKYEELDTDQGIVTVVTQETTPNPFLEQVNQSVIISGIVVSLTAGVLSWHVSRRITNPIIKIVSATKSIAQGQYEGQVDVVQRDEIGELAIHFNHMAHAMSEVEKTRQQLIADVSHELKTPLASIKGVIEGFQDKVIEDTPENYALIYQEIDRLQRLVQDLQTLSLTDTGVLQLNKQWWHLTQIAQAVVSKMKYQYETKSIQLDWKQSEALSQAYLDRERIEQVLINLLGNALQYTDTGGTVLLIVERIEDLLRFEIHDTGIGLKPDDTGLIFQRFYRVDKSRSRLTGGSGIGLTIAKNIVEAHDGRIWVQSMGVGYGTSIYFEIPLQ